MKRARGSSHEQVFTYRNPNYTRYALIQIAVFTLFALLVLLYFEYVSPWRGGFFKVRQAYLPVCGFLFLFWLLASNKPILELLKARNERIVLDGGMVEHYNAFGKLRFSAPIKEVEFVKSGFPVSFLSIKVKRYIFRAGDKYLAFTDEIQNVGKLLGALGQRTSSPQ